MMYRPDNFKRNDAASYDNVVESFDRHTQKYTTYAIDWLLRDLDFSMPQRVLDIGCGTGIVTLALAERMPPESQAVGIDLSDGMLAFAENAAAGRGVSDRARFLKCDAEQLQLPDASADAVLSLYAMRHLPHPDRAIAEAFRVLRPGGLISIASGSGPELLSPAGLRAALAQAPRALARATGRELAACDQIERLVATHMPAADEPEIATWSGKHAAAAGPMAAMVRAAGFGEVRRIWRGRQYVIDAIEDFWDLQTTFSSIARKRIARAAPGEIAALRHVFWRECEAVQDRGGRLVYRVGAAIVTGRKPRAS